VKEVERWTKIKKGEIARDIDRRDDNNGVARAVVDATKSEWKVEWRRRSFVTNSSVVCAERGTNPTDLQ